MKEIEANKVAWGQLSKAHYEHYKKAIQEKKHSFSKIIDEELGGHFWENDYSSSM